MQNAAIVDASTAARIRGEWEKARAALQGKDLKEINDPLGEDGLVAVKTNSFRHTGGGEVVLVKGAPPADRRYTRFKAYGPHGEDTIEKSSYLIKANGATEFHKRRVEMGDKVTHFEEVQPEDQAWIESLS